MRSAWHTFHHSCVCYSLLVGGLDTPEPAATAAAVPIHRLASILSTRARYSSTSGISATQSIRIRSSRRARFPL